MEEQLISFETAKIIKAIGFDELCDYHYSYGNGDFKTPETGCVYKGGFIDENGEPRKYKNSELAKWELPYGEFSAPTQSLLQKWLREECSLHIEVKKDWQFFNHYEYFIGKEYQKWSEKKFETYEEALEEGLKAALILINL